MTLTGQQRNGFVGVEVELSEGAVKGWVPRETLNRSVRQQLPDDPARTVAAEETEEESDDEPESSIGSKRNRRSDENEEEEVLERPRSRLRVPKDEGVLLRRDDSFFYGIFGGGGISFLQNGTTNTIFFGPGFSVGGYGGYIFSSSFSLQGEFGYAMFNGDDPDGNVPTLSFGFFSAEATAIYAIDRFELHGGIGYYYGLSLSASASNVNGIGSAADLSTITFHAGGAFRFPLNDVLSLGIAGRYTRGLVQSPVGISIVKGMVYLQFRG